MSVIGSDVHGLRFDTAPTPGPVTRRYLRRTLLVYAAMLLAGVLPALLDASPSWQAFGLGLWLPGAGFLVTGGWAILLFPLALVLFALSVIAWFWAGMVVAPIVVWLGAALAAGAMAGPGASLWAYIGAAALLAGGTVYVRRAIRARHARDEAKAARRREFLPQSLAEVQRQSVAVPDAAARELTPGQLESLRYVLDRALQPVDEFAGFTIIDQFQPAALRYQLNHMGFALGIAQGGYLPNFHGYLHEAQRNLISKYLLRRVWGYWVYESCWGHFNFSDFDPARRDNIMLTGWLGMHVGQFTLNSGDFRYAEPGSLTFRLNGKTSYPHDLHTIVGSVVENYEHYIDDFCLFPCEPNWMYPICNHYGMTALATHDRLFGTDHQARLLPAWLDKLDSEFTDRSGSIIGLRSQLTGIEFPFPVGEAGYAHFENCFVPDRARRLWAIARREIEPALTRDADGHARISLPGKGLDAGNYSRGFVAAYGGIMVAAREFGDEEIAAAAQRSLDQDCTPDRSGGSLSYLGGSNIANVNVVMGRLMGTGDFRRSFVEGPDESTLSGPYLTGVPYPDVLVARAYSTGRDLSLVLYPGTGADAGTQTLRIERLAAGHAYRVSGTLEQVLTADGQGACELTVRLAGRTELHLAPAG